MKKKNKEYVPFYIGCGLVVLIIALLTLGLAPQTPVYKKMYNYCKNRIIEGIPLSYALDCKCWAKCLENAHTIGLLSTDIDREDTVKMCSTRCIKI